MNERVMAFKLFSDKTPPRLSRTTDPDTSDEAAAKNVNGRASQQLQLLHAWARHADLTDTEAMTVAALPGGWRRCSELRKKGLLEWTGETRIGERNIRVRVSRITERGRECLKFVEVMR